MSESCVVSRLRFALLAEAVSQSMAKPADGKISRCDTSQLQHSYQLRVRDVCFVIPRTPGAPNLTTPALIPAYPYPLQADETDSRLIDWACDKLGPVNEILWNAKS